MPVSYLHGGFSDLFEKVERALEGKVEVVSVRDATADELHQAGTQTH